MAARPDAGRAGPRLLTGSAAARRPVAELQLRELLEARHRPEPIEDLAAREGLQLEGASRGADLEDEAAAPVARDPDPLRPRPERGPDRLFDLAQLQRPRPRDLELREDAPQSLQA